MWLLDKLFPKHVDKTGYHTAKKAYLVVVYYRKADGERATSARLYNKDRCHDTSDLPFGEEHWYSAYDLASSYANRVKMGGFHHTENDTYHPVHMVDEIHIRRA